MDLFAQEAFPTAPAKPRRMCQVPGCLADLEAIDKPYCCLKRICPVHMKADAIPVYNQVMRYCQQCGILEPLGMFEFNKRSCRGSLDRRVKRPSRHEQKRERRKRRALGSSGPSSSNEASNSSWRFTAAANYEGAASAAELFGLPNMDPSWDAAMSRGVTVLPSGSMWGGAGATAAASWGGGWQGLPAAAAAAAVAVPAAGVTPPASTLGVLPMASAVPADVIAHVAAAPAALAAPVASCAAAGMPWLQRPAAQLQPVQLQPVDMGAAAASTDCPVVASCSSSNTQDPAVLELEQFMLQELAAAGALVMDSSSATRMSQQPAAVAAPLQPQLSSAWQATQVPQQQQQQQQQQLLLPSETMPVLQHQSSGVYTDTHQAWQRMAASPTLTGQHTAAAARTAAPAAVHNAVGLGVAGRMQPLLPAQVVPTGCAAAAAAVPGGSAVGQHGRNTQVMAQLQDRLLALQDQMEDMQVMLGLLQNS